MISCLERVHSSTLRKCSQRVITLCNTSNEIDVSFMDLSQLQARAPLHSVRVSGRCAVVFHQHALLCGPLRPLLPLLRAARLRGQAAGVRSDCSCRTHLNLIFYLGINIPSMCHTQWAPFLSVRHTRKSERSWSPEKLASPAFPESLASFVPKAPQIRHTAPQHTAPRGSRMISEK